MRKGLGIMAALAVGGALFVGAADVSAQGRGNGKGRGGDKGGGKPAWAGQQQQRSDRDARRQQTESDRESRRQQEWSDRKSREQQRRSDAESRRQQEWSDRQSRGQQRRSDRESRRQQEWSDRSSRGRGDGRGDERRRSARKENGTPYWANRNYERPQENRVRQEIRRERKDYEKAERRYEKEYRKAVKERDREYRRVIRDRYDRDYRGVFWDRDDDYRRDRRGRPAWAPGPPPWAGPKAKRDRYYDQRRLKDNRYYDDYYYGDDDHYDDRYHGGSWRDELLRVVLGNFLGGQGFDGGMPYYAEPRYAAYPVYASPMYTGNYYQPAYYNDAGYYVGNDLGGTGFEPLIVGLVDQFSGGYVSDLLARTLATGYYEGLQDGMYARQRGIYDDYYTEPYSYAGNNYSMCSVSLGERRRLMAEGYELGYRDAMLQQQTDYHYQETPAYFDLVSLALGNVL